MSCLSPAFDSQAQRGELTKFISEIRDPSRALWRAIVSRRIVFIFLAAFSSFLTFFSSSVVPRQRHQAISAMKLSTPRASKPFCGIRIY
jgi:hypothetical protein